MGRRNEHISGHPLLYIGLLLIAAAVVVGLFAEHPEITEIVALSLDLIATVAVACGLAALLVVPVSRILRHKN